MFSTEEFIAASRYYVCVRLESFENQEHHDMVRTFLRGAFANTAFCLLAPDGQTRLSGSGRGPSQALTPGRRGPGSTGATDGRVITEMSSIAKQFKPKGDLKDQTVQDFHTFRQALNVASADQRLLIFVVVSETGRSQAEAALKPVMADEAIIGRFHVDFADKEADKHWADEIKKSSSQPGYAIIRADQFGQSGSVMKQLPLSASSEQIKEALLMSNELFAASEERKDYGDHVSLGRREGIYFENEMPYGEDRNGDGVIDSGGVTRSKGKGRP